MSAWQVLHFGEVMLRHPLLPGLLLPVVAMLFGAGRGLGLPLLFWHEHRGPRFLAGLGTSLLAAEILFVAYLLAGEPRFEGLDGLTRFLAIGGAAWLLVVGLAALVRARRYGRARQRPSGDARLSSEPGVAPAMHLGGSADALQAVQIPVGAFLLGVGLAVLIMAGLVAAGHWLGDGSLAAYFMRRRPGCPVVSDPRLHLIALATFLLFLAAFAILRRRATPALGLSMLLGLVAAVHGAGTFWLCSAGLGPLALLLLLLLAGTRRYRIRIPALQALYAAPASYPPGPSSDRPHRDLLPLDLAAPGPGRRKLIVLCTSGGGIRAAAWSAAVLGRLDEVAGARRALRFITGASGGMMGAASWVAHLHGRGGDPAQPAATGSWHRLLEAVAMNSLTPIARRLVFRDLPLAFLPVDNLHDRGRALEDAWLANLRDQGIDLGLPFGRLREGERLGHLPSLVFSPMLVEDGRRLIISNRSLRDVTDNEARWLSGKASPEPHTGRSSRGAYHLSDLFPEHWADLPLSTAARLSASFPYVSPAAVLPTHPRRRAVDAGYFDSYGLDLLCNLLREALANPASLLVRVSGILLVQVRDNVSQLSLNPDFDPSSPEAESAQASGASRGLEGIIGPPAAVLAAREAASLFRSDAQLETLCRLYTQASGDPNFLTSTIFEFRGEASLSWYLTRAETEGLRAQAGATGITGKLEAIARWLG